MQILHPPLSFPPPPTSPHPLLPPTSPPLPPFMTHASRSLGSAFTLLHARLFLELQYFSFARYDYELHLFPSWFKTPAGWPHKRDDVSVTMRYEYSEGANETLEIETLWNSCSDPAVGSGSGPGFVDGVLWREGCVLKMQNKKGMPLISSYVFESEAECERALAAFTAVMDCLTEGRRLGATQRELAPMEELVFADPRKVKFLLDQGAADSETLKRDDTFLSTLNTMCSESYRREHGIFIFRQWENLLRKRRRHSHMRRRRRRRCTIATCRTIPLLSKRAPGLRTVLELRSEIVREISPQILFITGISGEDSNAPMLDYRLYVVLESSTSTTDSAETRGGQETTAQ